MGGTFDPIHYGHLLAAEEARVAFELERVIFVPTGNPPHKKNRSVASAEDRYAMTSLAISDNPHFEISRIETDRGGESYTADTLGALAADCPGAEFFLIVGLDSALDIPNWYEPKKILSLCNVIAIARPGYVSDRIYTMPEWIKKSTTVLDATPVGVSATEIRSRVRRGRSIRYMTTGAVRGYIRDHNLYSSAGG
jgi:nicotinate-nucleotide adenylyltransferase